MTVETKKFETVPREVQAVQVTRKNMDALIEEYGGEIRETEIRGDRGGVPHIHMENVDNPLNDRQKKCFAGDWIVIMNGKVKFYTNKSFKFKFRSVAPKRQKPDFKAMAGQATAPLKIDEAGKIEREVAVTINDQPEALLVIDTSSDMVVE